jgi:hypothetical protein
LRKRAVARAERAMVIATKRAIARNDNNKDNNHDNYDNRDNNYNQ